MSAQLDSLLDDERVRECIRNDAAMAAGREIGEPRVIVEPVQKPEKPKTEEK